MSFHSYLFVFVFYPVTLAGFYLIRNGGKRAGRTAAHTAGRCAVPLTERSVDSVDAGKPAAKPSQTRDRLLRWWLILLSLFFYSYGHLDSLVVFAVSMAAEYALLRGIFSLQKKGRTDNGARGGKEDAARGDGTGGEAGKVRFLVAAGVIFHLLMLAVFKYFNFLTGTVFAIFGESFVSQNIVLPLGISFLTFQQISLLVDAGRGEVSECSLTDYLLYITFFPKVLMGPITTYGEMKPQFDAMVRRPWESERFLRGGALFVLGMSKKCILAQNMDTVVSFAFTNITSLSFLEGLIGMVCYLMELYFDFSGYCDMGRGVCQMMGMDLPVNFNSPLQSIHIVDYWKRWHMTLTRFFTRYVYIPLGGNRRGRTRMCGNVMLVFLLSGLWHGAAWTFVVWGFLQGILYVPVKLIVDARKRRTASREKGTGIGERDAGIREGASGGTGRQGRSSLGVCVLLAAARIGNFLVIAATLVFFRAATVGDALRYFATMGRSLLQGTAWRIGTAYVKLFQVDELWYVFKGLHLADYAAAPYLCMALILGVSLYFALFSPNAAAIAERRAITVRGAMLYAVLFVWCVLMFAGVTTYVYVNF
ncbi:MAG: MBOAT family O-acyltransferase [Eubacteriales bacterium]|nr:MBOAT family O-acyltransferase [Eubacteriales bacterium]